MNCSLSTCDSSSLLPLARSLGFCALGITRAHAVSPADIARYDSWIGQGRHAGMDYMTRNQGVRNDPRLLLEGAKSMIVCAMSYHTSVSFPMIASYAHGDDYHFVVRQRLQQLARFVTDRYGGQTRICVDTAPLRERYWAVQAGIGFIGMNNQLIVPGFGSYVFIGTILSTLAMDYDTPSQESCLRCGRCLNACPAKALSDGSAVDARRCLSYLTIEHRGPFPHPISLNGHLYGCDVCQQVCPHNADIPVSPVREFSLRQAYSTLTPDIVCQMTQEQFSAMFRNSAIRRTKLAGLQRNAAAIVQEYPSRPETGTIPPAHD